MSERTLRAHEGGRRAKRVDYAALNKKGTANGAASEEEDAVRPSPSGEKTLEMLVQEDSVDRIFDLGEREDTGGSSRATETTPKRKRGRPSRGREQDVGDGARPRGRGRGQAMTRGRGGRGRGRPRRVTAGSSRSPSRNPMVATPQDEAPPSKQSRTLLREADQRQDEEADEEDAVEEAINGGAAAVAETEREQAEAITVVAEVAQEVAPPSIEAIAKQGTGKSRLSDQIAERLKSANRQLESDTVMTSISSRARSRFGQTKSGSAAVQKILDPTAAQVQLSSSVIEEVEVPRSPQTVFKASSPVPRVSRSQVATPNPGEAIAAASAVGDQGAPPVAVEDLPPPESRVYFDKENRIRRAPPERSSDKQTRKVVVADGDARRKRKRAQDGQGNNGDAAEEGEVEDVETERVRDVAFDEGEEDIFMDKEVADLAAQRRRKESAARRKGEPKKKRARAQRDQETSKEGAGSDEENEEETLPPKTLRSGRQVEEQQEADEGNENEAPAVTSTPSKTNEKDGAEASNGKSTKASGKDQEAGRNEAELPPGGPDGGGERPSESEEEEAEDDDEEEGEDRPRQNGQSETAKGKQRAHSPVPPSSQPHASQRHRTEAQQVDDQNNDGRRSNGGGEEEDDGFETDEEAAARVAVAKQKSKERRRRRKERAGLDAFPWIEVPIDRHSSRPNGAEDEGSAAVKEGPSGSGKRRRSEDEDPDYDPQDDEEEEKAHGRRRVKAPQAQRLKRHYNYSTGGNRLGRQKWTEEETQCLHRALEKLIKKRANDPSYQIYAEVLNRHGSRGSTNTILRLRNNVQIKDKARNELLRMDKVGQVLPSWADLLFPTLLNEESGGGGGRGRPGAGSGTRRVDRGVGMSTRVKHEPESADELEEEDGTGSETPGERSFESSSEEEESE
ncbi:hypothetical protein FA10DRAFT_281928 [Acaromyces ingoldii]|uniref:Uncharacterized protein n=1 Tax=Acaromyces ingoldii TaxID=215250 RepID=A0A316YEU1_9BASI|nr:hypothetical protein FA10DRAFT_281928 [Acaromyces ingoldii]PWN87168.1 hypothetical protein FA10DRAFT_281928 [Acaromyces ingoldii]